MSEILTPQLRGLLDKVPQQKQLRFSSCNAGYQWSSIKVGDHATLQVLLWLWNHRERIAEVMENAEAVTLLQALLDEASIQHDGGATIFTIPDELAERVAGPMVKELAS